MNRKLSFYIEPEFDGQSIGNYLKIKGVSHPIIVHLKKTEQSILLNGEWSYVNSKLKINDLLEISIIEDEPSKNIPASFIEEADFMKMVVFEDDDILVINKPAGLAVHPSMGHHDDTLANYCAYYFQNYSRNEGAFVFRCVNRLDRDTSGLVLIAKNMLSSAILSASQLSHAIKRTYYAICTGDISDTGVITLPIARKDESVIERCVDFEKGETAITHYKKLKSEVFFEDEIFSLAKIQLETGRTHQIRVHMKAIGHPLPGDFLYNPDFRLINRQALHSYALDFTHPITKEPMAFTQKPPEDFFIN